MLSILRMAEQEANEHLRPRQVQVTRLGKQPIQQLLWGHRLQPDNATAHSTTDGSHSVQPLCLLHRSQRERAAGSCTAPRLRHQVILRRTQKCCTHSIMQHPSNTVPELNATIPKNGNGISHSNLPAAACIA